MRYLTRFHMLIRTWSLADPFPLHSCSLLKNFYYSLERLILCFQVLYFADDFFLFFTREKLRKPSVGVFWYELNVNLMPISDNEIEQYFVFFPTPGFPDSKSIRYRILIHLFCSFNELRTTLRNFYRFWALSKMAKKAMIKNPKLF